MKTDTPTTIAKVFLLFLAVILTLAITYHSLFLKQNEHTFNYFNTVISVNLPRNQEPLNSSLINTIDDLLKSQENKWGSKPDSYIVKLNAAFTTQNSMPVDDETIELINKIKIFHKTSNEYFNPTIGKLINYWEQENKQSLNLQEYLDKLPVPDDLQIKDNNITSINSDLQLNINGIISAHILIQIKDILVKNNIKNAQINMGNDLYLIKSDGDTNYRIIEKDTNSKKMPTLFLKVYNNEFLSTSGIFLKDSSNVSHTIVDPKTGKQSYGFYGSTVIDKDPYNANVASIALIIAGPENYIALAQSLGIESYILYTYDNKIIISEKMKERM